MVKYSIRALFYSFYFFVLNTAIFVFCTTMFSSVSDIWRQYFIKYFDILLKNPESISSLLIRFYFLHLIVFILLSLIKKIIVKIRIKKKQNKVETITSLIGDTTEGFYGHLPVEKE